MQSFHLRVGKGGRSLLNTDVGFIEVEVGLGEKRTNFKEGFTLWPNGLSSQSIWMPAPNIQDKTEEIKQELIWFIVGVEHTLELQAGKTNKDYKFVEKLNQVLALLKVQHTICDQIHELCCEECPTSS